MLNCERNGFCTPDYIVSKLGTSSLAIMEYPGCFSCENYSNYKTDGSKRINALPEGIENNDAAWDRSTKK